MEVESVALLFFSLCFLFFPPVRMSPKCLDDWRATMRPLPLPLTMGPWDTLCCQLWPALISLHWQNVHFSFLLLQGIMQFDQMCFEKYGKVWGWVCFRRTKLPVWGTPRPQNRVGKAMSPPCLSTVIPVVTACKNLGSPLGKSPAISPRLLSCWDSNAVQGWDDGGQLQGGRGVSFFLHISFGKNLFFSSPL